MEAGRFLVTGATGQIGSELVFRLRKDYGTENVIVGYHSREIPEHLRNGPSVKLNITRYQDIVDAIKPNEVKYIINLAGVLSAGSERDPNGAWIVNVDGYTNVLEAARQFDIKQVFEPSSMAVFGPENPRQSTPNDVIPRPIKWYGRHKLHNELLGTDYIRQYGLDVRGIRYVGLIGSRVKPTGGTTDELEMLFWEAVEGGKRQCELEPKTRLPMLFIEDALDATFALMEAPKSKLRFSTHYNIAGGKGMSMTPEEVVTLIRENGIDYVPSYRPNPVKLEIASSWPESLDDTPLREDCNWTPKYDAPTTASKMIQNIQSLRKKLEN